ncbi:MAG: ribosome maturation factor RimM [Rubrivivax sp.]|jgi:16S rRNA processing protein RimM
MDLPFPDDAVEVGRVAGAWGVKGWIKVQPFSLDPQALFSTRRWFLRAPSGASAVTLSACAAHPVLMLTHAKEQGGAVVACAQGLEARDAAEALRGARVYVSRASFPTAAQDEFYWVDLIGLTVVNRQGVVLGEVVGLMETGAHDVLRVQASGGGAAQPPECLIPFVAAYVDDVDQAQRRITVDWGLDY